MSMFKNILGGKRGITISQLQKGKGAKLDPKVRAFLLKQLMSIIRAEIRKRHGHRTRLLKFGRQTTQKGLQKKKTGIRRSRFGRQVRATKLAADRFARAQSRKVKAQVERQMGFSSRQFDKLSKATLARRFRPSEILDILDPGRRKRWQNVLKRPLPTDKVPLPTVELHNFDMIRNPEGTLDQLIELSRVEGQELIAQLDFTDKHVNDAGAFLILNEIWPAITASFSHGRMDAPIQKVISAIGLDRELGFQLPAVDNHDDIWAFPAERRRPKRSTKDPYAELAPTDRDKVATRFCELVDQWLDVPNEPHEENAGYELTLDAKGHLTNLIGELLCNAERHSQAGTEDGDWSTTAFMVRRQRCDGEWELICHMAFLSVGQSMADSLSGAPPEVRSYVDRYVKMHSGCGLSRETLETIVALQDAVTGNVEAYEATRGGFGLQDVLEFINDLAEFEKTKKEARVTIVSGKSCIQLCTPYLAGVRDPKSRKRLHWCNEANKQTEAPDRRIASDLKHRFAGTLVTVAFTLDNHYVENLD